MSFNAHEIELNCTVFNKTLEVSGTTSLSDTLTVSGTTTLQDTLTVSGDTTFGNALRITTDNTRSNYDQTWGTGIPGKVGILYEINNDTIAGIEISGDSSGNSIMSFNAHEIDLNCSNLSSNTSITIGDQILTADKIELLTNVNANELIAQYISCVNRNSTPLVMGHDMNIQGKLYASALDINCSFSVGNNIDFNDSSGSYADTTIRNNSGHVTMRIDASTGDIISEGDITTKDSYAQHAQVNDISVSGVIYNNTDTVVSVSGRLNVLGEIHSTGSIYTDSDLNALGNANISGNIIAGGNGDISGDIIVGGNASISGDIYADGDAYITGFINCTNINLLSDLRLKRMISDISPHDADMLLKLETKSFCWKRDESNKKVFGLIAQDVQKIYPDLIANGGDFLRIDYMQLIPLLIHKIQNMDNDMNKIKRTMKHMQAQMDMIVSKLNI